MNSIHRLTRVPGLKLQLVNLFPKRQELLPGLLPGMYCGIVFRAWDLTYILAFDVAYVLTFYLRYILATCLAVEAQHCPLAVGVAVEARWCPRDPKLVVEVRRCAHCD